MKSKNSNTILHMLSIGILLFGVLSTYMPSLFWLLPLGVMLLQGYLFFHAHVYSGHEKGSPRWKTYRFLSFFSMCILFCIYYLLYQNKGTLVLMQKQSSILIFVFMLVFGNYAPKIPYNRSLGIRLPWTLQSEDTWRYAHRIAGYSSIPCAFFYLCIAQLGYDNLAGGIFLIWILIPSLTSYRYAYKKKGHL